MDPGDVGAILDADFGIAVREGLHCAPLVHESLGASLKGDVRFSLGSFTSKEGHRPDCGSDGKDCKGKAALLNGLTN
jgi:hypothetical protein